MAKKETAEPEVESIRREAFLAALKGLLACSLTPNNSAEEIVSKAIFIADEAEKQF